METGDDPVGVLLAGSSGSWTGSVHLVTLIQKFLNPFVRPIRGGMKNIVAKNVFDDVVKAERNGFWWLMQTVRAHGRR